MTIKSGVHLPTRLSVWTKVSGINVLSLSFSLHVCTFCMWCRLKTCSLTLTLKRFLSFSLSHKHTHTHAWTHIRTHTHPFPLSVLSQGVSPDTSQKYFFGNVNIQLGNTQRNSAQTTNTMRRSRTVTACNMGWIFPLTMTSRDHTKCIHATVLRHATHLALVRLAFPLDWRRSWRFVASKITVYLPTR